MVLDASKTESARKCKSIDRYVQNYPGEMQTNSLILAKNHKTNENKSVDFSAFGNSFRCVQNQSLDQCEQITQFIAHENANQFTDSSAIMKMVLDVSKANP